MNKQVKIKLRGDINASLNATVLDSREPALATNSLELAFGNGIDTFNNLPKFLPFPIQTNDAGKFLTTDGNALNWNNVNTTPAGTNGQLQFNNNGSFGADSSLNWDNTNKSLLIGSNTFTQLRVNNTSFNWMGSGEMTFTGGNQNAMVFLSQVAVSKFGLGHRYVRFVDANSSNKVMVNIGQDVNAAPRLNIVGLGTDATTFALQVHNISGNNNALVVRDDGRVGIGINNPLATLHIANSAGIQLRLDNGGFGGNGLSGTIQFTTTDTSFIAMARTGGTSAIISIPPSNNNQDGSFLHINYNNSGGGLLIYPRRTFDGLAN